MNHRFTTGPWEATRDSNGVSLTIRASRRIVIAGVSGYALHAIDPVGRICFERNARLLAAAPRLLGALEGLRDKVGNRNPVSGEWGCEFYPAAIESIREASAAIVAATEDPL